MATRLHEQLQEKYKRVSSSVDLGRMVNTALYVVGTGASGPLIESFARLGVKRFVLFDPDTVETKNLVAQNFTHKDVGRKKTEAMRDRIADVEFERGNHNVPSLSIDTFGDFLQLSDDAVQQLIDADKAAGRIVVLVMATDLHPAQARANRIALLHGVPTFWVGIYRAARAGEIVFFEPRTTDTSLPRLGCYRCLTASRYAWWDENMRVDFLAGTATGAGVSGGLPMAAGVIDNMLAHLVIGAIHFDDASHTQAKLYRRLCQERRNLIQIQLDQDYATPGDDPFVEITGKHVVTFKTAFQSMPKLDECPDCEMAQVSLPWKDTNYLQDELQVA